MGDFRNNKKIRLMLAQGCRKEDFERENISIADLLDAGADQMILRKRGYTKEEIINKLDMGTASKRTESAVSHPYEQSFNSKPKADVCKVNCRPLPHNLRNKSIKELKEMGFSPSDLRKEGIGCPREFRRANYRPSEVLDAKFTLKELKSGGYTPEELLKDGLSLTDVHDAGFELDALLRMDIGEMQLKEAGYTVADFKKVGYKTEKLIAMRFTLKELHDAGIDLKELLELDIDELKLKKAGYTVADFKKVGYKTEKLIAVGFTLKDLHDAGIDLKELLELDIDELKLKNAGYSAPDFRELGYDVEKLMRLGFDWDDLLRAKISPLIVLNYYSREDIWNKCAHNDSQGCLSTEMCVSQIKGINETIACDFPSAYYFDGYVRRENRQNGNCSSDLILSSNRIWKVKHNDPNCVTYYSNKLKSLLERSFRRPIHICVIPSHEAGMQSRGVFSVLDKCDLPDNFVIDDDALIRITSHIPSYQKNAGGRKLSPSEQYHSMIAFDIKSGEDYLILDDLMTTHASMQGAAQLLKDAGARRVYCLSFGQTLWVNNYYLSYLDNDCGY